jgi:hypothetical protein
MRVRYLVVLTCCAALRRKGGQRVRGVDVRTQVCFTSFGMKAGTDSCSLAFFFVFKAWGMGHGWAGNWWVVKYVHYVHAGGGGRTATPEGPSSVR